MFFVDKKMHLYFFLTAIMFILFLQEGNAEPSEKANTLITEKLTSLGRPPAETAIIPESLTFSSDATNVAYVVSRKGEGMLVCVNEKTGRLYDSIGKGSLRFSPGPIILPTLRFRVKECR